MLNDHLDDSNELSKDEISKERNQINLGFEMSDTNPDEEIQRFRSQNGRTIEDVIKHPNLIKKTNAFC